MGRDVGKTATRDVEEGCEIGQSLFADVIG